MVVAELDQVTVRSDNTLPAASLTVAVSCCVVPIGSVTDSRRPTSETVTDATAAGPLGEPHPATMSTSAPHLQPVPLCLPQHLGQITARHEL